MGEGDPGGPPARPLKARKGVASRAKAPDDIEVEFPTGTIRWIAATNEFVAFCDHEGITRRGTPAICRRSRSAVTARKGGGCQLAHLLEWLDCMDEYGLPIVDRDEHVAAKPASLERRKGARTRLEENPAATTLREKEADGNGCTEEPPSVY